MDDDLCNHVPICGLSHWAQRDRAAELAHQARTTREDGGSWVTEQGFKYTGTEERSSKPRPAESKGPKESGCASGQGARKEWTPKPTETKRDPRPPAAAALAAAAAGRTGSKAGAPPILTNRGRWSHSSLQWAGPSCRPDVGSWTAGDASATQPLQARRQGKSENGIQRQG